MNVYREQASFYSNGISIVKSGMEETLSELQNIKESLLNDESSNCLLNFYVNEFNDDMIEKIESLILKCSNVSTLLLNKANELDRPIEIISDDLD